MEIPNQQSNNVRKADTRGAGRSASHLSSEALAKGEGRQRTKVLRRSLVAGAFVSSLLLTAWFFLPCPPLLDDVPFSAVARDRNGALMRLTMASDQCYRLPLRLSEVPQDLILAVTTQEDHRYRSHFGVDLEALIRDRKSTRLNSSH